MDEAEIETWEIMTVDRKQLDNGRKRKFPGRS